MKKLISWILALTVLASLAACGTKTPAEAPGESAGQRQEEPGESAGQQEVPDAGDAQQEDVLADTIAVVGDFLYQSVKEPTLGSVGGEWLILGLARSGLEIPAGYYEDYFQKLAAYTAENVGVLHAKKYTEYSRVILALTAIDRNPADLAGFNMLLPLADFDKTVFQGINGPVFALLALDSGSYEIPENVTDNTQATREMYVDYIVNAQLSDGGWAIAGGEAEIDITAMALQALAKYRDRQDVERAIDRGLSVLSAQQNENGGYAAYGAENSESVSQVIVALAELGISSDDSRFVKNGNTLLDALQQFQREDGGFAHVLDGETDLMATEQAFYALVAMNRMMQGESSLYKMK